MMVGIAFVMAAICLSGLIFLAFFNKPNSLKLLDLCGVHTQGRIFAQVFVQKLKYLFVTLNVYGTSKLVHIFNCANCIKSLSHLLITLFHI